MLPLEPYRVLDFGTAWAGPMAAQVLADMGAEVIKVESLSHMDGLRLGRPLQVDDDAGGDQGLWPNMQPTFHSLNRNKKSLVVDMTHLRGRAVVERLAAKSDVLLNNFAPGVMDRLGLGYDHLSELNPQLVMVEQSAAGRTGPWRGLVAYANGMHALGGLSAVLGYRGEPPLGAVATAYADANAAMTTATAALAGLWHRRQTGFGQYVDISGIEALLAVCGELIFTPSMTGNDVEPAGNRQGLAAPCGIYRTAGDDEWLSLAIVDDDEWARFVEVAGAGSGLTDARWTRASERAEEADALDALIEAWSMHEPGAELGDRLAAADVAAFPVRDIGGLYFCPHHKERDVFPVTEHPQVGFEPLPGLAFRLHGTPGGIRHPAPDLGEHTRELLTTLVGQTDAEIADLAADGTVFLGDDREEDA